MIALLINSGHRDNAGMSRRELNTANTRAISNGRDNDNVGDKCPIYCCASRRIFIRSLPQRQRYYSDIPFYRIVHGLIEAATYQAGAVVTNGNNLCLRCYSKNAGRATVTFADKQTSHRGAVSITVNSTV